MTRTTISAAPEPVRVIWSVYFKLGGRSGRTAMFGNPRTKPALRSAWKSRSNVLRSAEVADH